MTMIEKIPQSLASRRQWVLWRTVTRGADRTKVPFQPTGHPAKSSDPATWRALADVIGAKGFDGPGFVFSADDPFVGIDLDGCRDPATGQVEEWAREVVRKLDSYAEVSPSGAGIKVFCAGEWRFGGGRKCTVDAPKVPGKEPGIEVYSQGRYFAVTGRRLSGVSPEVEHRQDALDWLAGRYFTASSQPAAERPPLNTDDRIIERARKYLERIPPAVSGQRGHDRTFHAACVLVLGFGLAPEDAYALLCEWNQSCDPPWTERELRHKVADAVKQPGERNYLRNARPEEWDRISVPRYGETPAAAPKSAIRIDTLEYAARQYVEGLNEPERVLRETGLPEVDHAIGGGYDAGEMIVLAARPSHGKSAIALQMIHAATGNGLPSLLVSEEMPALTIGKRTAQFASEVPEEDWRDMGAVVLRDVETHFEKRAACYVVENCGSAERAVEEIEKAVEDRGVKIAVVDYAQLLRSQGRSRYEQVTNTSLLFKSVASRTKVSLVVLCQLNREIEKRNKFQPKMSDLKETGQFEQDADVILFLVWPHRINSSEPPNEYSVYIGKNRNRAINKPHVTLKFLPSRQMVVREEPQSGWVSEIDWAN